MSDERTELLKLAFSVQEIATNRRSVPEYPDLVRYSKHIYGQYIMTNGFFVTYKSLNLLHYNEELANLSSLQETLIYEKHIENVQKLYRLCGNSNVELERQIKSVSYSNQHNVIAAIAKLSK